MPAPALHQLTIKSPNGYGADSRILIDGEPVPNLTGLTLLLDADGVNRAELSLAFIPAGFNGRAHVTVPKATARTLEALGWTPPGPHPAAPAPAVDAAPSYACCDIPAAA